MFSHWKSQLWKSRIYDPNDLGLFADKVASTVALFSNARRGASLIQSLEIDLLQNSRTDNLQELGHVK